MEVGIDRVRLAEIARRASMSSGQVMYYFTSKEHILLETLAWQEHQDLIRRRAALGKVAGAWRQLNRFIGLYLPTGPPARRIRAGSSGWKCGPARRTTSR